MSLPRDFIDSKQTSAAARLKLAWEAACERAVELEKYVSTLMLSIHNEADVKIAMDELAAIQLLCEQFLRKLREIDRSK